MPVDREQILQFLVERAQQLMKAKGRPVENISESLDFVEEDLLDSLGFIGLIQELEEKFNMQLDLSDADPEQLVTLRGLADTAARSQIAA